MLSSAIYSEGFIGHEAILQRIEALVTGERVPHAMLFTGPEGVGKYLAACWTSAAFLCEAGGCGQCVACRRVLTAVHPDFHVVRAEEGRRDILISQVRELRSNLGKKPFEGDRKAAIIDGADRMNEESQNAFLKTLEEPPPGTLIILVSSTSDRLLSTIRSRCQRFPFSRLSDEELGTFVSKRLQIEVDFPARLAQGSPGRLLKLSQVDAGRARAIFFDFIVSRKVPSPVRATSQMLEWAGTGGPLKQTVRERLRLAMGLCMGILRDLACLKEGAGIERLLNRDLEEGLAAATLLYDPGGIFVAARELVEAAEDIAAYVDPGLAVENAFRTIRDVRTRG